MRLTLRTLLAYLDNTLDPDDAEALRSKLGESGFATQLVQRIRGTLVDASLSAPLPTAVNPIEEPNVISEYLDSTLPSEQVAEIERACLESDPHLAEAAACHQILTMVLGKKGDVSEKLRQRIYDLPERELKEIPVSGSFSSVALPDAPTATAMPAELPTPDPAPAAAARPIEPVGAADSGVSDAPTRLRESGTVDDVVEDEHSAAAGLSGINRADLYGGSIRTSRITPWLVSLALAGVLLFALARIFAPLLENPVAQNLPDPAPAAPYLDPDTDDLTDADEIEVSADDAPVMETVGTPGVDLDGSNDGSETNSDGSDSAAADSDTVAAELPMPEASGVAADPTSSDGDALPSPDPSGSRPSNDAQPSVADPNKQKSADTDAAETAPTSPTDDAASPVVSDTTSTPPKAAEMASDDAPPESADLADASTAPDDMPADAPPTADAIDVPTPPAADGAPLAKVTSDNMLLLARTKDSPWGRIKKDMMVTPRATVLNPPKFYPTFNVTDKVKVTLSDATEVQFIAPVGIEGASVAGVNVAFGRTLIQSTAPDISVPIKVPGYDLIVSMPEPGSVVAVEVRHLRRPGFDPFVAKNHIPIARVLGVEGDVSVSGSAGNHDLSSKQQVLVRGSDPPKKTDLPMLPDWVDRKETDDSVLDESAREGLLALLEQEQPILLSLREAVGFRKSEVAALAAQTMLHMGHSDVYFGTDGILSQSKQRAYWTDHFRTLRSSLNRSPDIAGKLQEEIAKMDSANGKSLVRLLVGFSQSQLVEGADEELIEMLDSNSMAVRVMATENLREITGTTSNFRPEEENAVRRVPAIKKWQVRLRKGDIRWTPES
ncbi:MAG: hypothetical protein HKN47_08435 [Pirellulaceae bacterium]|nr:hypothetical protein [Pirellulaceae bacterium]